MCPRCQPQPACAAIPKSLASFRRCLRSVHRSSCSNRSHKTPGRDLIPVTADDAIAANVTIGALSRPAVYITCAEPALAIVKLAVSGTEAALDAPAGKGVPITGANAFRSIAEGRPSGLFIVPGWRVRAVFSIM